ncbi:MAG: uncharacterized protein PWP72_1724 [Thermoanaerobacter sp.]|nr:uncharacterized protein [Thermoanaerobacter sp.]
MADLAPGREQLAAFSQRLWEQAYGQAETGFSFPSWEAAFCFMGGLARQERLIVVLDEFPYLMETNPAIPSILQKVWDPWWDGRNELDLLAISEDEAAIMVAPQGSIPPVIAAALRSFPGRLPPAGHSRPAGGGNGAGIPTPGSLHGRGTVY